MFSIYKLVLLFALATIGATGGLPVHAQTPDTQVFPVPAGARTVLEPTKTRYLLGENIVVHFGVVNQGAEPFALFPSAFANASRNMRFQVSAVDGEGKQVARTALGRFLPGYVVSETNIKPSESWFRTFSLLQYCRIEQPGTYKIRVESDWGWKAETPRLPIIAEAQIELVMPSPEQAKQIVEELEAAPGNAGSKLGEKNFKPFKDFSAMGYPVYLPLLLERIDAGNLQYLPSLAGIETPEATGALVERLKASEPMAIEVAKVLATRLPVFEWSGNTLLIDNAESKARQDRLVAASWRDEFAVPIREYAVKALATSLPVNREMRRTLLSMLENIGTAEDLPVVLAELNKHLTSRLSIPYRGVASEDCRLLLRCAGALVRRGGILPPESPTNPATIAVLLNQPLAAEGAEVTAPQIRWLKHPIPFIRQLTLEALAERWRGPQLTGIAGVYQLLSLVTISGSRPPERKLLIAPEVRGQLPALLKDSDDAVRTAACELVSRLDDKSLLPLVLEVLSKARHGWEIGAAQMAAQKLGGQYQAWEVWANRLDDPGMLRPAIDSLVWVIKVGGRGSWHDGIDESEGQRLKPRWQQFLKNNRERLEQGQLFTVDEAGWPKDLFPKNYR